MNAEIGVIGGSGLYEMPGFEAEEEIGLETPWGTPSDAYVVGRLAGREVAFLSRHGRGHLLSPSEINYRANIHGMKQLGVDRIISLSAVGSLKEEHKPLDFVLPDQFFDRTRGRASTFFGDGLVAHISFAHPVCPQLTEVAEAAFKSAGVTVHRGGTYLCMEGPAFSTRAESRLYRSWDVGKALVANVIALRRLQEEGEVSWTDLGGWEARSLVASAFRLDGGAMFGQVPKPLWSRVAKADEQNRIPLVVRCLLLRRGADLDDPAALADSVSRVQDQVEQDLLDAPRVHPGFDAVGDIHP